MMPPLLAADDVSADAEMMLRHFVPQWCDVCPMCPQAHIISEATSLPKATSFARQGKHHSKKRLLSSDKRRFFLVGRDGFEPSKSLTADLQSAPFGHSGTYPYSFFSLNGAGGRTRTPDLLITNQLLYQLSYTSESLNARILYHRNLFSSSPFFTFFNFSRIFESSSARDLIIQPQYVMIE